jgi:hypothetical protein
MSDHVHEWHLAWDFAAWCNKCPETIDYPEIERRLNATERLSAEDATELRNVSFAVALLDGEASEKAVHAIKAAEAYAAALEGE